MVWRNARDNSRGSAIKERLITYNAEDCEALALITRMVSRLAGSNAEPDDAKAQETEVIRMDDLRNPLVNKWRKFWFFWNYPVDFHWLV